MAAATFLDLLQIWAPLEQGTISKIKYAKFHALRIAKAIKAGEDPNAPNPAPEPALDPGESVLDPNDPDVQMLDSLNSQTRAQSRPYQPSVEDVPDEQDRVQRRLAQESAFDQSLHASRATSGQRQPDNLNVERHQDVPSPQDTGEAYYQNAPIGDVSPIDSAQASPQNGGYFPRVPGDSASIPNLPQPPPEDPRAGSFHPEFESGSTSRSPYAPPSSTLHSFPPPPIDPKYTLSDAPPQRSYPPQPPSASVAPRNVSMQQPPVQTRSFPPVDSAPPAVSMSGSNQATFVADEEAILKAQKHARWAISALNFEDVNTAVKELRGALESLGA